MYCSGGCPHPQSLGICGWCQPPLHHSTPVIGRHNQRRDSRDKRNTKHNPPNPAVGLGYLAIPDWAKREGFDDNDPETYKHAWLGYQARLRARFLGGSVRDDGEGKKGIDYSRAGLTAEVNFEPFIFERVTASISYSFLPAISGPIDQDFYLEAGLGYTIWENPAESRKVNAELKYIWGALDNKGSKKQDQLTASIGVMF
jgi:hypothetical protein